MSSAVKGKTPQVGDRVLVEAVYNPNMPFKWNAQRIQTLPQLPNQTVSKANLPNSTKNWNNQRDNLLYIAFYRCHCSDVDCCAFNLHIAPGGTALTSSFPTAVQLLLRRRSTTLHWHTHSGGLQTKCNLCLLKRSLLSSFLNSAFMSCWNYDGFKFTAWKRNSCLSLTSENYLWKFRSTLTSCFIYNQLPQLKVGKSINAWIWNCCV